MQPYKISAVSYLNTQPFIKGIEDAEWFKDIILTQDFPAKCAEKLLSGEADIALVPVAVIPELTHPHIIGEYCIGVDGPVKTVCLFSEVPIHDIKTIYLDYQSRTSVRLLEVLCKEYWHISPRFVKAFPGYMSEIKDQVAGVVIGDRAVAFLEQYPYIYDLAETWKAHTSLPFVFATWVANKALPEDFIQAFNQALKNGLQYRDTIAERFRHLNNSQFNTLEYLYSNLDYPLDERKKLGMETFLEKLTALEGKELQELSFQVH